MAAPVHRHRGTPPLHLRRQGLGEMEARGGEHLPTPTRLQVRGSTRRRNPVKLALRGSQTPCPEEEERRGFPQKPLGVVLFARAVHYVFQILHASPRDT
ncbi:hypothetical protein U9M48_003280 [Paspalum notatum var. saurae]|uniref:Uncharacterized protein n=1 Tax=Paspalum notatum var. saurae TaxID=547442 RepID=A0AAQ3PL76_PASNO